MSEQNINIIVTDKAKDKIAEEGYDPEYGARPLIKRYKTIEDNLSELILDGNQIEGKKVTVIMMVKSLNMTLLNKLQKLKHHRKHNYKTVQNKLKFWAFLTMNYRNS